MDNIEALRYCIAPLEMTESEFRKVGRQVIERIAEWLCSLPNRPVAPNEVPFLKMFLQTLECRGAEVLGVSVDSVMKVYVNSSEILYPKNSASHRFNSD